MENKQSLELQELQKLEDEDIQSEAQVKDLIAADQNLERAFLEQVDKLTTALVKQKNIDDKIEELTHQILKAKQLGHQINEDIVKRLTIKKRQKKLTDEQVLRLEFASQEMMKDTEKFRELRDQVLTQYYQQKQQEAKEDMGDYDDANEEDQIKEDMKIIDAKSKEIENFNNRNFKVDEEFIKLFQPLYEKYEEEILNEPFIEYTEANPPTYFPKYGVWFNHEDQAIGKPQKEFTQQEKQELQDLDLMVEGRKQLPQRSATVVMPKQENMGLFGFLKKHNKQ